MKGSKKQREKEVIKPKTKSPHSIGASVSSKVLNVSKKSHIIQKQTEKPATVQSKLTSIKNENGSKSLIVSKTSTPSDVSKVHATRPTKSSSVVSKPAAQVELKKSVEPRLKASGKEQKSNTPKEVETTTKKATDVKNLSCKHCNLHFSTPAWLKKHVSRCHAKAASVESKIDPKVKILKYKQQLDDIQQTLEQKNLKEKSKKKSKLSPGKQKLRDQLKTQLAAQQKLLQVQQEIFEKTSKAQQDIFNLIAKLGDGSESEASDDAEMSEEELPESHAIVKYEEIKTNESEEYVECPELIVAESGQEFAYLTDNYGLEEQLITDDSNYVLLNEQNTDGDYADEKATMVIVHTDNGEEEYELIDVVEDQMFDSSQIDPIEQIDFEVVGKDSNSVHCRIVSNETVCAQEEVEYVDVQVDEKVPVKVDVGNIQQIAQKRFSKQLEGDKKADDKDKDAKLLNTTIHKSEKQTNEYIQKVVQNAIPTDDNKFECPICHEMVSNRYSLGPHILRLHSKQKSKICQFCDRSFTCTGDLTRHIRIHTGEKPFKCSHPNCTYAFRASGDLHKHMRRHNSTTVNIRQHVCKQCDRAFERNYDLKRHELTHKKNEEGIGYNCEFCSKRFVRKDQHKAHVYRHLGIKQYKCPDCNRHFSDFSNCSKHIRQCQAGDVKPFGSDDSDPQFICEICNKRFKSKVGMKQHIIKCAQITELQRNLQESFKQMEDD